MKKERKLVLTFGQDTLAHCCGIDEVGGFRLKEWVPESERPAWNSWTPTASVVERSNTGIMVATFNDKQKEEYGEFSKLVDILYQSPPKRSSSSGNQVFLVVAQYKKPKGKSKLGKLPVL